MDVTPALFWALTQGLDCARGSELFTYNAQLWYKESFEREAWQLSQKLTEGSICALPVINSFPLVFAVEGLEPGTNKTHFVTQFTASNCISNLRGFPTFATVH